MVVLFGLVLLRINTVPRIKLKTERKRNQCSWPFLLKNSDPIRFFIKDPTSNIRNCTHIFTKPSKRWCNKGWKSITKCSLDWLAMKNQRSDLSHYKDNAALLADLWRCLISAWGLLLQQASLSRLDNKSRSRREDQEFPRWVLQNHRRF